MKKLLCMIAAALIFTSAPMTAAAAEGASALPSGIAYSEIEEKIDAYVKDNAATTAALSVAVLSRNEVLMKKAYGYTDIENAVPNVEDSVFEWGSCTKLLVWVSAMQLAEQGKLDLNEDIRTYLPNHFLKKLKYNNPITMLNLMNHNAGWQETVTDLFIENRSDVKDLGDALRLIEPEQVNRPGEIVAYSNWGAALAGYIVECVSGESFDAYVHEHIFKPLGMEYTALNAALSDNPWVAGKRKEEKCYSPAKEALGTCQYYLSLYPAGMATGTLGDFIRFAQALLPAQGANSPLFEKSETLKELFSPSLYFADGKTPRNCHGFWTDELGVPVIWHNGGTIGSSSWFTLDPVSGTAMIILTNQSEEATYNCGLLPFVFGKYDNGERFVPSEDISGLYVSSTTCFKGYAKPYSLISLARFSSDGKGGYFIPGTNETLTPVGDKAYIMDMGGLKQFPAFASADDNGNNIIQLNATDYVKVNGYGIIAEIVLLALFVLAAVYGLCALTLSAIRFIRRKMSRGYLFIYREAVNLFIVTVLLLFVYVTLTLFSGLALLSDIRWSVLLIAALALLTAGYIILLIAKWKKLDCSRREKFRLILSAAAGLIMISNVIFWEAYRY